MSGEQERHVLGISGGKDSAALAVWMAQNHPELPIEYFFTDTGKELPEVYEYLGRLEGLLGRPIARLNPERDFDFWLKQYNHFLPSPKTRWCTRQLKIKPFENWIAPSLAAGVKVTSYVAIRADEEWREGHAPTNSNLIVRLPFREAGVDRAGVVEILEGAGVGMPTYYAWRSRSGCTFCFFQQKVEWANLLERHPAAFEEAKSYEKDALEHGSPFTWSQGESLTELARPERIKKIREENAARVARLRARRLENPLRGPAPDFDDADDAYGTTKGCLACHR
jgi:hypothetical protein